MKYPLSTLAVILSSPLPACALAQTQPYAELSLPAAANTVPDKAPSSLAGTVPAAIPARDWVITPSLSLREAYTDNVRLTAVGQPDTLTTIGAGLTVEEDTRRLKLTLDGQVTYDAYRRATDLDGIRYAIYGNALGEVIENTLMIDTRASINVQPISANGVISAIDRRLPGNQVEVINASISPYLIHDFGSWASGELRYRLSLLDYSGVDGTSQTALADSLGAAPAGATPLTAVPFALANTTSNQILANLRAGPEFTMFRWVAEGWANQAYYSAGGTVTQSSFSLTGEYALMRQVALIAIGGFDSFSDSALAASDQLDGSVRVGTRLTPGPRTDLLLEGGTRYGGPYWSGQFRYRVSSKLLLSAIHREMVTTQQDLANSSLNDLVRDDQGRLADPLTGNIVDPNFFPFSSSAQSFSLQTSRIELGGSADRTSGDLSLEYDQRVLGASSLGGGGGDHQNSLLVGGSLSRQLTRRSDLSLSFWLGKTEDNLSTGSYSIRRVSATYDYDLTASLRGSLGFRRYTLNNEIGPRYSENAATITLRREF
jgi:hypothetical protein